MLHVLIVTNYMYLHNNWLIGLIIIHKYGFLLQLTNCHSYTGNTQTKSKYQKQCTHIGSRVLLITLQCLIVL